MSLADQNIMQQKNTCECWIPYNLHSTKPECNLQTWSQDDNWKLRNLKKDIDSFISSIGFEQVTFTICTYINLIEYDYGYGHG